MKEDTDGKRVTFQRQPGSAWRYERQGPEFKSRRPDKDPPKTAYVRTHGCKRSFVLKQSQPETVSIQTFMKENPDSKHVTFLRTIR